MLQEVLKRISHTEISLKRRRDLLPQSHTQEGTWIVNDAAQHYLKLFPLSFKQTFCQHRHCCVFSSHSSHPSSQPSRGTSTWRRKETRSHGQCSVLHIHIFSAQGSSHLLPGHGQQREGTTVYIEQENYKGTRKISFWREERTVLDDSFKKNE